MVILGLVAVSVSGSPLLCPLSYGRFFVATTDIDVRRITFIMVHECGVMGRIK
jgi:hypothetical protein